mmetsp:Transcript_6784/g.9442  ORF Transcript_6784/g.9442 Transcript_6784/m.9442 type:complete len:82 (+) Transcript_6784:154-399(+)
MLMSQVRKVVQIGVAGYLFWHGTTLRVAVAVEEAQQPCPLTGKVPELALQLKIPWTASRSGAVGCHKVHCSMCPAVTATKA